MKTLFVITTALLLTACGMKDTTHTTTSVNGVVQMSKATERCLDLELANEREARGDGSYSKDFGAVCADQSTVVAYLSGAYNVID